eukprot:5597841-Pyramimonas_sp.AAC.1
MTNSSSSSSSSLLFAAVTSRSGLIPLVRQKRVHHLQPTLPDLMVELASSSGMTSSLVLSQSSRVL